MIFHSLYIVLGRAALSAAFALLLYSHGDAERSLRRTVRRVGTAFFALTVVGAVGACQLEDWDWLHGLYWSIVTYPPWATATW
jgi:hypothetical protein